MKNLTFILLVAISVHSFSQNSIPNSNFESWVNETIPLDWQTTNQFIMPDTFNVIRTTDNFTGQFALQLSSILYFDMVIPGVATLGTLDIGTTYGGIPFTERPSALTGFVKHPSLGDEIMLFVEFFKNGNTIGSCYWSTTDSLESFTQFTAPVTFISNEIPDTMNITMLTDPNKPGSRFIIDELAFEYDVTGLDELMKNITEIYPNPAKDVVRIKTSEAKSEVRFSDITGKDILSFESVPMSGIDISQLKKGLYIVTIETNNEVVTKKLIKQ